MTTFLTNEALEAVRQHPPGLELVRYWRRTAEASSESANVLLSYLASNLLQRGWIQPADKVLDAAVETLNEPRDKLQAAWNELVASDLVKLDTDGQRVTTIAGILATRPTGLLYYLDIEHQVHLSGPLAGLAVAQALQKKGEVRAACAHDKGKRLAMGCDTSGIFSRKPESIAMFLPAWDGTTSAAAAMAGGGFFADDDALGLWQEGKGDPAGMPLASFMFPMAATDLGQELGAALERILNHLPDFS